MCLEVRSTKSRCYKTGICSCRSAAPDLSLCTRSGREVVAPPACIDGDMAWTYHEQSGSNASTRGPRSTAKPADAALWWSAAGRAGVKARVRANRSGIGQENRVGKWRGGRSKWHGGVALASGALISKMQALEGARGGRGLRGAKGRGFGGPSCCNRGRSGGRGCVSRAVLTHLDDGRSQAYGSNLFVHGLLSRGSHALP
jgi:hypothetical protein